MSILVICTNTKGSDVCRAARCRWMRTLVHELPETIVVLDEVIEPLLDVLGIPEKGFSLFKGFVLWLHTVEEGF
jgi:hypothetical protein